MALPPPADDATVVVTGASSGIGRALAEELARRGHHVTLIARRRDRLHELAERLAADHGVRAEAIGADLSSTRSRARAVRTVREGGLRVSGVCNNAGVGGYGVFHEMGEEHLGRLVALNVNAVHELTLAFVPAMVERGAGAVLNVASILGHGPVPRHASYSASKAFVVTLSEALHAELAGSGVSCTALSPGPVRTDIFASSKAEALREVGPGFLWQEPEDVARAGVDAMERGSRHVIPGLVNQLFAAGARHLPRALLPLAGRVPVGELAGLARRLLP